MGIAAGIPYVFAVLIALWSPHERDVLHVSAACILLMWVGYFLPIGDLNVERWHVLANRGLSTLAVVVTTMVAMRRKRGELEMNQLNVNLAERVVLHSSERDEVQQALQDQDVRYRSLMESLPINVFQKDLDGNIVFGNKRYFDMNAVIGYTELALNTRLTPEQREYMQTVLESSESLLGIINDVLDFSKVEAGKLELESTSFSLREVVGDTMKTLAVRAQAKSLEMICDILSDVPDALVGAAWPIEHFVGGG